MDVLRGAAIGLVILAHAAYILDRFELGDTPGWLIAFNEMFAPYRMPTLMFLSGMLVPASLRKPPSVYFSGKVRAVAWPYLVWLVIWCALFPAYGNLLTVDTWWTSYLWFLLYIFTFYLLAPVTRWIPTWLLVLGPWIAAAAIDSLFVRRFFFLMGFFFLGKLVADHRGVWDRVLASRWSWLALPAAVAYGVVSALLDPRQFAGALAPLSVIGVLAAVQVARAIDGHPVTRPLQHVGRNSLIYYVTHFPVIVVTSWIGYRAGLPVLVTVAAGFLGAILVGRGFVWLSEHTPLRIMFRLGSGVTGRRQRQWRGRRDVTGSSVSSRR